MDLNQLKTFVTVAEEGHLTRAAERLFTSQPAVSAQLKALEESLGVSLFDRTPKGMRLTPAGEKLLKQAHVTLESVSALMAQAKEIQGAILGELAIGVNSDCSFLRVPQLLSVAQPKYPGIQISFVNGMSPDILLDIRKGKLDSGFFFGPAASADLSIIKLADIESAVVAPVSWADQILNASVEDLAKLPWIYSSQRCPFVPLVNQLLGKESHDITKVVYVDTEEAIREFVKIGSGVAFLRASDAEKAEREGWGVRWPGPTPSIRLSVAIQTRRQSEPLIRVWLEELLSIWPEAESLPYEQSAG